MGAALHRDQLFGLSGDAARKRAFRARERGLYRKHSPKKPAASEQANGGTVFLDEIGEIAPSAQIRLLRVLQTQQFERLGGEKTVTVNVRILAATNRDPIQEVRRGNFREDLYYRLNVIPINLPPLEKPGQ